VSVAVQREGPELEGLFGKLLVVAQEGQRGMEYSLTEEPVSVLQVLRKQMLLRIKVVPRKLFVL